MSQLFNFENKGKSMSKLMQTAGANKLNLLKGYEGVWIQARRSTYFYVLNKMLSITVALFFAFVTLSVKKTTLIYQRQQDEDIDLNDSTAFHIRTIYWFMFIYYSLHAMDEMIELFSVINQLEKGALGLFFELNYLIGLFNAGHCIYFSFEHKLDAAKLLIGETSETVSLPQRQASFDQLQNFLVFQYYYSFFSFFMLIMVWCMYSRMNTQAKNIKPSSIVNEDAQVNLDYAINKDE